MAAPFSINIQNLQGKWILDKKLSDPLDPVLNLTGVGWLARKAIALATVTQHLKHFSIISEFGQHTTQIDIDETATGGLKANFETRTLDWQFRESSNWISGTFQSRSRYNTLTAISEEAGVGRGDVQDDVNYLVNGWLEETQEGHCVESFLDNEEARWTGWQILGFAEIEGERRLTRKFAVRKKDKDVVFRIRLVYNWAGFLS